MTSPTGEWRFTDAQ